MLSSQRNVQENQLGSINPQQDMDFPVKFKTGLHKDSSIVCLKSISGPQHANQDQPIGRPNPSRQRVLLFFTVIWSRYSGWQMIAKLHQSHLSIDIFLFFPLTLFANQKEFPSGRQLISMQQAGGDLGPVLPMH